MENDKDKGFIEKTEEGLKPFVHFMDTNYRRHKDGKKPDVVQAAKEAAVDVSIIGGSVLVGYTGLTGAHLAVKTIDKLHSDKSAVVAPLPDDVNHKKLSDEEAIEQFNRTQTGGSNHTDRVLNGRSGTNPDKGR